MKIKILLMGLSGAGKTTLSNSLVKKLSGNKRVVTLNADEIREAYNDWDFSYEGRMRQAARVKQLSDAAQADIVVMDLIAPLQEMRDVLAPDLLVWVDTVKDSNYSATDKVFQPPTGVAVHVTTKDALRWASHIANMVQR